MRIILLLLFITGCNATRIEINDAFYKKLSRHDPGNIHYKGHYKIGKKYKINKKRYYPREVRRYNKIGIASWYGDGFHNKKTANGDIYNKNLLTAAHKTLQLPSLVRVTNLENNRSLIVLVNDRGPYIKSRIIDLSEKVASILQMKKKGIAKVRVKYLHDESQKFLKILRLKKEDGSIAKQSMINKKCSVNCQIKLVNLRQR